MSRAWRIWILALFLVSPDGSRADVAIPAANASLGAEQSALFSEDLAALREAAQAALESSLRNYGAFQPSTAWRYEDLGMAEWHLGRMAPAKINLEKALSIHTLSGREEDRARLHLRLAQLQEEWGHVRECEVELARAMERYRSATVPDPPGDCSGCSPGGEFGLKMEARRLAYRMSAYAGRKDFLAPLEENLADCLRLWPGGNSAVNHARVELSLALGRAGKPREALSLAEAAQDWQDRNESPHEPARAEALEAGARASLSLGKKENADLWLREAATLLALGLAPSKAGGAQRRLKLAEIYGLQGLETEAREAYALAGEELKRVQGAGHPQAGLVEFRLGQLQGRTDKAAALGHLREAGKIWRAAYGPDHPALTAVEEAVRDVQRHTPSIPAAPKKPWKRTRSRSTQK